MRKTCFQHFLDLLKDGWKVHSWVKYPIVVLEKDFELRELDLRNDVIIIRPNQDIFIHSVWTQYPNSGYFYEKIDDETADDDTTYITTNNLGYRCVFGFQDIETNEHISHIIIYQRAKISLSYGYFINYLYVGSNYYYFSSDFETSYETKTFTFDKNPINNQNWTKDDINNLQLRIEGRSSQYQPSFYITQIYIEVYTIPAYSTIRPAHFGLGVFFSLKEGYFTTYFEKLISRPANFSTEQEVLYDYVKIFINGEEVNSDIKSVKWTDSKDGFSNKCVIETRALKEKPAWLQNGRNTIAIRRSNVSSYFEGYFDYWDNKERKPVGDVYVLEGYNWVNSFKDIFITEKFYDKYIEEIMIYLISTYLPDFSLAKFDYTNTKVSLVYVNQSLFQVIQDLVYLSQFDFWVSINKSIYFLNNKLKKPLTDKITDLDYNTGKVKFEYDVDSIKNVLKIKGGLKLSTVQTWEHTVASGETIRYKIYPEKIYNIMVYVNDELKTIGQKGKDDGNSAIEVLFDAQTLEFTFNMVSPPVGSVIKIYYQYAYTFQTEIEDKESIKQWGRRETEVINVPYIVDNTTAYNYGRAYLTQYAQPKLVGEIEIDMKKYPSAIHAGDTIEVDLSRYYTGKLYIEEVEYLLTPTKFRANLKLRKHKDIYAVLKHIFDTLGSIKQRLAALETQETSITYDRNLEETITLSDSVTKNKFQKTWRWSDELIIGQFTVEEDNYAYY